jgi:anti-sigma-K factor RskA
VNNLPKPAAGKQYQLWAIVNGQPVDAGMLNWNDATIVASMKNIPQAQAFAITLEDEGGHPLPQGVMYVLGSI